MPKHIHADLMMQYAQDAQESATPWENWECQRPGSAWVTLPGNPIWYDHYEYRRKPKTIVINGFTVNAPMDKEPEKCATYFYPCFTNMDLWDGNRYTIDWDKRLFDRGLCFTNKEDAIAMAKAMLQIDPNK